MAEDFPARLKIWFSSNGQVKEPHAPRSIHFGPCSGCPEFEQREFQLSSVDLGRGVRIFRCAHCGYLIELGKEIKE